MLGTIPQHVQTVLSTILHHVQTVLSTVSGPRDSTAQHFFERTCSNFGTALPNFEWRNKSMKTRIAKMFIFDLLLLGATTIYAGGPDPIPWCPGGCPGAMMR